MTDSPAHTLESLLGTEAVEGMVAMARAALLPDYVEPLLRSVAALDRACECDIPKMAFNLAQALFELVAACEAQSDSDEKLGRPF